MSELFKNTLNKIQENKKNLEETKKPNCIPFAWFPKLRTVIPGIIKGTNWIVTANTGVGKTQFTKYNFVYQPIKWIKEHPESGLSYKVLYFALEESKEEFMLSMISNRLYDKYGIDKSVLDLQSMFEKPLEDSVMKKIEECQEYFEDLDQYIEIIDSISNPTGIYKYVRQYSLTKGVHYFYDFINDKEKKNLYKATTVEEYKELSDTNGLAYSHYEPNNPDEYVAVIVDHFSLLQEEKGAETLHKSMSRMSADYGRKMITKHFKYIFINVQQQAADGEKAEFTKMGEKIEEKFKPTLANLADNKLTARDCHVVLGLFAPVRYNIKNYEGYDIRQLEDKFRSLVVLKNRIGAGYIEDALYFNGKTNDFRELPKSNEMTTEIYNKIKKM